MHAWSRYRGVFLQNVCPYKFAILNVSILFKANYGSNKKLPSNKKSSGKFACEEDNFVNFKTKKGFAFSPTSNSSGEFSCPL